MLGNAIRNLLRVVSITLGVLVATVLPALIWASMRREVNEAAGYSPNMDPGVMLTIATMIAVPIILGTLLVEIVRSWVYEGEPLAYISLGALGILVGWPVGVEIMLGGRSWSTVCIAVASVLSAAVFYAIRFWWLLPRKGGISGAGP